MKKFIALTAVATAALAATPALAQAPLELGDPRIDYIHAHCAKPGCYLARIDRA